MQIWTDWCRLCNSKFHSFPLAWSLLFTVGIVTSFLPKPFQTTFQNQLVVKSWFRNDIIKASSKAILKTGTVFRKLILKHLNRERIRILDINCAFTQQCLMSSYYSVIISIFFKKANNQPLGLKQRLCISVPLRTISFPVVLFSKLCYNFAEKFIWCFVIMN